MRTSTSSRAVSSRVLAAVAASLMLLAGLPFAISRADAVFEDDGNADLEASCGVDITLIIDRSGSIGNDDDTVADAAEAMVNALIGTGSKVQQISFSSTATAVAPNGSTSSDLSSLSFTSAADISVPTSYGANGGTNWDDALEMARRSPVGVAPLTIMITDGRPTVRNVSSPNGHGGNTTTDGNGSQTSAAELAQAVLEADRLKDGTTSAGGSTHMFTIGVGSALNNATDVSRLKAISGNEALEGPDGNLGTADDFPFAEADYTLVQEFEELREILEDFVKELCAPTVNLTKLIVPTGGTLADAAPAEGWQLGMELSGTDPIWENPPGHTGLTVAGTTDSDGVVNFKWENQPPLATAGAEIDEMQQPGFVYVGAQCFRNIFDGNPPTLIYDTTGDATPPLPIVVPGGIGPEASVNCSLYNRPIVPSTITVDKVTDPAGRPEGFDFTLTGPGGTQQITDLAHSDAPESFTPVMPGTYTIAETPEPGFTLSSATCDDQGTQTPENVSPTDLVVGEDQSWLCQFVNTADNGSIEVAKQAVGADGTFDFSSNFNGSFDLTTVGGTATTGPITVPVGNHSVTEGNPLPWSLTGATCSDGSAPNDIDVGPGENVICTFVNAAPDPSIDVTKSADPTTVTEPGSNVTFTAEVTNTSVESLTITTVSDAVDGDTPFDVTTATGPVLATTCDDAIGTALAPGDSYDCTFTLLVAGNAGDSIDDEVAFTLADSDANTVTETAEAAVSILDAEPTIVVTKSASADSVDEPGTEVDFTTSVTNTSPEAVTITGLTDAVAGGTPFDVTTATGPVLATTCQDASGTVLDPGETYDCTFTLYVGGNAGDTVDDTVTFTVEDDDDNTTTGTADEDVIIDDVLPTIIATKDASVGSVDEPGAQVEFATSVTNTSPEPVTITGLTDAVEGGTPFGVTAVGGPVLATTCDDAIGTILQPAETYDCTFTLYVRGDAGDLIDDEVAFTVEDDDDNATSGTAEDDVTVDDVLPTITATKDAAVGSVDEPGEDVSFDASVTNTSPEPVTITSVLDSVDGGFPFDVTSVAGPVLATTCDDALGTILQPAETYDCSFVVAVSGFSGDVVEDIVSFTVEDDDGNETSATADEDIAIDDVVPTISVDKDASVESVDEPGDEVTFTTSVTNTSLEPVTIVSVTDSIDGASPFDITTATAPVLATTCDDAVGTDLEPGDTYTCDFRLLVAGNASEVVIDTVTFTVEDDDQNLVPVEADEDVAINNVDPSLTVTKSADPNAVAEPGDEVDFSVSATNTSVEPVTIVGLTDAVDGGGSIDVGTLAGPVLATTCDDALGTILEPGETYSCSFRLLVSGDGGDVVSDTVTFTVEDDDSAETSGTADDDVTIRDVEPTILVTKQAEPTAVDEPGDEVDFPISVTNTSPEPVTITTVIDSVDGGLPFDVTTAAGPVLATTCDDADGTVLEPGDTYGCTFTLFVGGNAGETIRDAASFTVEDNDGNMVTRDALADVVILDVAPGVDVTKTAGVDSVDEPGDDVSFTATVTNTAPEAVTITALVDAVDGGTPFDVTRIAGPVLATTCDDAIGTVLEPGETYDCSFTLFVGGLGGELVRDVVSFTVADDDGNDLTSSANDDVAVNDLLPTIETSKSASALTVAEPGAEVDFTAGVTNTSTEPVTITSITDAIELGTPFDVTSVGGLVRATDCGDAIGTVLAPGQFYQCTFTVLVSGNAGDVVDDAITFAVVDDEGNPASGSAPAAVEVTDVSPTIDVAKSGSDASVPEPGAPVEFTASVTNRSPEPVTIIGLTDAVDGGPAFNVTTVADPVTATTCDDAIGTELEPGETYSCQFTLVVSGNAGDTVSDVITFTVIDDDGNETPGSAAEDVDVDDVAPTVSATKQGDRDSVPEPGDEVAFTVTVTNTSTEAVTITALADSVDGGIPFDVTAAAGPVLSTTCGDAVGTLLEPGGAYSCTFSVLVSGDADDVVGDQIIVTVVDDDGTEAAAEAPEEVLIDDVSPTLDVTKTASSESVDEPGDEVEFTVDVRNTSPEPITIIGVTDAIEGGDPFDVTAAGGPVLATTCGDAVGTVLAPDGSYSCSFTVLVSGDGGDIIDDEVTVTATDDDGNEIGAVAPESVVVDDVSPTATATKTASADAVAEPGDEVAFTASLTNTSPEAVTITGLTDAVDGGAPFDATAVAGPVLSTTCGDAVGTVLGIGETYTCEFTLFVAGDPGDAVIDVITFTLTDDDGNETTEDATESVDVEDVDPTIDVDKDASTDAVDEPGAPVDFTASITNTSPEPVTIVALTDAVDGGPAFAVDGVNDTVLATSCGDAVGTVLDPGQSYDCTYTLFVGGNGDTTVSDQITFAVTDDEGNETTGHALEVVDVDDVAPTAQSAKSASPGSVSEPGAAVTFTAEVTNTSVETVTITGLTDAVDGGNPFDVTTTGGPVLDTTCGSAIGRSLAPGATYRCTFTLMVNGDAGDSVADLVTFTLVDDDGNEITDHATEEVPVDDVVPTIDTTKGASVETVSEPGAEVTFSASVTNTSPEPVTITGLTDSIGEGDPFDVGAVGDVVLATTCGDAIGTVLAVGQSYGCEFTVLVSGNADDVVTDEIRFTVSDNEGNSVSDGAKADVTIDDVVPSVEVAKSDGDVTVAAPGDEVTYTVEVTNTSNEPVTVTALTDRIGEGEPFDVTETGDEVISTTCGDLLGSLVSAGETITCEFSVFVASDEAGTVDDLVRVTVTDDEGNEAVDEDDETTPVTAVADLIAAKTVQSNLTPGATGVYRLAATNDGPSTATGVILTDELPSGMTITSIDAGAWDCEDSTDTVVACTLASLAAGTTASVDVTVQVPTSLVATTVTNVVEVEGNEDDPNLENNRAELDTVIPAVLQVQQPQHTQASPVAQALAVTGSNATALAMLAIALLITGGAAVGFSRRRRASELDC